MPFSARQVGGTFAAPILPASETLLVPCGAAVRVVSTGTGELLQIVCYGVHTAPIVAVLACSAAKSLFTCSLDCRLVQWAADGVSVLAVHVLPGPAVSLCESNGAVLVAVEDHGYHLYCLNAAGSAAVSNSPVCLARLHVGNQHSDTGIMVRFTRSFAACTARGIHVVDLLTLRDSSVGTSGGGSEGSVSVVARGQFRSKNAVHSIAACADSNGSALFAVGDAHGEISLLRWEFVEGSQPRPIATVHWHSSAVSALHFISTSGGAESEPLALLSGGAEGVLVAWRFSGLISGSSTDRTFVPRMGSRIQSLASDPSGAHWIVHTCANSIFVISASRREVQCIIQGIPRLDRTSTRGNIALCPLDESLVVADDSKLLFFGVKMKNILQQQQQKAFVDGMQAAELAVEHCEGLVDTGAGLYGQNVTRQHLRGAGSGRLQSLCFSSNGSTLATYHVCSPGSSMGLRSLLRFWKVVGGPLLSAGPKPLPRYELVTTVISPHRGRLRVLACSPAGESTCFVSGGEDGALRFWVEGAQPAARGVRKSKGEQVWTSVATLELRSLPIHCACFSPDGSILAVAFGPLLTLWDSQTYERIAVLPRQPSSPVVSYLVMISPTYLAAADAQRLVLWDVTTLRPIATYSLPPHSKPAVLVAEESRNMIVFGLVHDVEMREDDMEQELGGPMSSVLIFRPPQPTPLAVLRLRGRVYKACISCARDSLHSSSGRRDVLFGVSLFVQTAHDGAVFRLSESDGSAAGVAPTTVESRNAAASTFSASSPFVPVLHLHSTLERFDSHDSPVVEGLRGLRPPPEFAIPAHIAPAPATLFRSFMTAVFPASPDSTIAQDARDARTTASTGEVPLPTTFGGTVGGAHDAAIPIELGSGAADQLPWPQADVLDTVASWIVE